MRPPAAPDVDWVDLTADLRAFVARRVRGSENVDDVVQETLLRIVRGMSDLRDVDRLLPWAMRIARNTIADHYRRSPAEEPLEDDVPESDEVDEDNVNGEVAAWLRPMMATLSDADRQALELTELRGMSQKELAEHLGISRSGARTRVQRARKRLRTTLERCCALQRDRRGNVLDYEPCQTVCCD